MTDYDAGYLQALKDVQTVTRERVRGLGSSSQGRTTLFGILAFLNDLIQTKERQDVTEDEQDAPDPLGGSF